MNLHPKFPHQLYLVISEKDCLGRNFLKVAEEAILGGVDIIQLREKNIEIKEFLQKALQLKEVTEKYNIPLIINDHPEVAKKANANGIHVGNNDKAPTTLRDQLFFKNKMIGYSIEYLNQLENEQTIISDYLGVSPIFSTKTKKDTATEWGIDGLSLIRSLTEKPLVAIGNINIKNAEMIMKAGANSLAVVSAICTADNPEKAAFELKKYNIEMKKFTYPSVMTIAGFDGSGGAGIQADIKTFSALGCYATSVLTALPVQNTQGVRKIYPINIEAVADQIKAVLDDIFPMAVKIGMVHTPELVEAIVNTLKKYPKIPIVFDPVMVATSGHRLIEEKTIATIIEKLFPISEIITPNMDEAAILADMDVKTLEDMEIAGKIILRYGCKNILLKGGHQKAPRITSLLLSENGELASFETEKFITNNTHGSGCTLSSAIAAFIARGEDLKNAVSLAQSYVFEAIKNGKDVVTGKGNGPLNHFLTQIN